VDRRDVRLKVVRTFANIVQQACSATSVGPAKCRREMSRRMTNRLKVIR
jgi:hypothetical protein